MSNMYINPSDSFSRFMYHFILHIYICISNYTNQRKLPGLCLVMSKLTIDDLFFPLQNDEHMSNKVRVEHQPATVSLRSY